MRHYSSVAPELTLTANAGASDTTISVDTVAGLPTSTPFTLVLDAGQAVEEIVTVVGVAGTTLTVERGQDGTAAQGHFAGAAVRHMATARDFREPQQHMGASTAVHGLGASESVVGTAAAQQLYNKDLADPSNTFPSTLVTTSGAQTVTGKTISGSSNTLSDLSASNVTTGTLNAARLPASLTEDTGWVDLTLVNGWVQSLDRKPQVRRIRGVVHLRGQVEGGSGQVTTLPAGFRPAVTLIHPLASATHGYLQVNSLGGVTPSGGATFWSLVIPPFLTT